MYKTGIQVPRALRERLDGLLTKWRQQIQKLEKRIAALRDGVKECEQNREKIRPDMERAKRVEADCRSFFAPSTARTEDVSESRRSDENK